MRKLSLYILVIALSIQTSHAQNELGIECSTIQSQSNLSFNLGSNLFGVKNYADYFETPPWIAMGCWRGYFAVKGGTTIFITTPINFIDGTANGSCGQPEVQTANLGNMSFNISGAGRTVIFGPNSNTIHRRTYGGIYSSHILNINNQIVNLGFVHGENGTNYSTNHDNSIREWTGSNLWDDYYSFISVAWVYSNAANQWGHQYYNDTGPIAWPASAYIKGATRLSRSFQPYTGGIKQTNGPRHPSSIIHNGYIYVYYYEDNLPLSGKQAGIKLLRVPITDAQNYLKYKIYKDGNFIPSLPTGLRVYNQLDYMQVEGPDGNVVVGGAGSFRFSVAKVRGKNYFLGIQENLDYSGNYKITLHKSVDLINWGPGKVIISNSNTWEQNQSHYPIFLDKYGKSNTDIDEGEFYILFGYSDDDDWHNVRRFKMSIKCTPPPPPPPPPGGCPFPPCPIDPCALTLQKSSQKEVSAFKIEPEPCNEMLIYSSDGLLKIDFQNEESAKGIIQIYNLNGKLIREIDNTKNVRLNHSFDMKFNNSGSLYLVRAITNYGVQIKKVLIND